MILVAGSANLDFVVRAARIPSPGETVLGRDFRTYPGGKGANQAVAAARAGGAPTHMLLGLGDDAFARPLEASLASAGVVMHTVRPPDLPTGTAFICVSDDAENAITVAPGANEALRPEHLPPVRDYRVLLMQLETPLASVTDYARQARAAGTRVLLNAAPAQSLPAELLALVDVLVVNEGELAMIAGAQGSIREQVERLPVPTVVVTLGARGVCALDRRDGWLLTTAFPIHPIDTTGAGDTFCGVLAAGLDAGQPLAQAMRRAAAAAALACTVAGAQSSIPQADAVDAFLARSVPATPSDLSALRAYCDLPLEPSRA
jgi:ribokinase